MPSPMDPLQMARMRAQGGAGVPPPGGMGARPSPGIAAMNGMTGAPPMGSRGMMNFNPGTMGAFMAGGQPPPMQQPMPVSDQPQGGMPPPGGGMGGAPGGQDNGGMRQILAYLLAKNKNQPLGGYPPLG